MLRPEVIEGRSGRLLAVVHATSAGAADRTVVVVPPFGEEMNKSRRMITQFATAAALRGCATIVPDLSGTGDSDGNFEDARWDLWCDDLQRVVGAAKARSGAPPDLLAIRSGALLASALLEQAPDACRQLLLWAPVTDGERFMKQFLRLRMAASLSQSSRESVADLEAALRQGTPIEVAGYALAPELWSAFHSRKFAPPPHANGARLDWFDVLAAEPYQLSPASQKSVAALESAGWRVRAQAMGGAAFWGTAEIAEIPELVTASVAALELAS